MKVLEEGYLYEAENFDKLKETGQKIQFIHKEPLEGMPSQLHTTTDGTTNEELLSILIDRIQFLQKKMPCRENAIVLTNLETAQLWLEKRTNDRRKREVEGKLLA